MKTGVYSVLYEVALNMAIIFCFIPSLLLSWKKMRQIKAYRVIGAYWFLTGLINFMDLDWFTHLFHIPSLPERLNLYYTLLETPLVLWVFICAASGRHKQHLLLLIGLYIAGELFLTGWNGYNFITSTVIIGSGLLLTLGCSVSGLVQYMKKMEHTRFENSMVFVYAALLFSYGSFLIIYVFTHLHDGNNSIGGNKDSLLLYYISLLLSATITTLGLWYYGIRQSIDGPPPYSSSSS